MGVVEGLAGGLIAGLQRGGGTYLRHHAIRALLARAGSMPHDMPGFLHEASRRVLLRRVGGGGYQFLHRILMDHLVSND
jgi:hypothetical protein